MGTKTVTNQLCAYWRFFLFLGVVYSGLVVSPQLGVVLHEMLTGQQPFRGENSVSSSGLISSSRRWNGCRCLGAHGPISTEPLMSSSDLKFKKILPTIVFANSSNQSVDHVAV